MIKAFKGGPRTQARALVVQSLYAWHFAGGALTVKAAEVVAVLPQSKHDAFYFSEAICGIDETMAALDALFSPCLSRTLEEVSAIELAILRLGTWELQARLEMPYKVVINEAVNLAKSFGAQDSHKFVNAVLDRVAKKVRVDSPRL